MSIKSKRSKLNIDDSSVESFGDEWSRFDQSEVSSQELSTIFNRYFSIFPWRKLSSLSEGFDMGCGSGRWAKFVAPRVRKLHCVEPSLAIKVAEQSLTGYGNVVFHRASVDSTDLMPNSQDFGYSIGVLHHVPDTCRALRSCVDLLKPGAPLLIYLYYAFDNRPYWFRTLWRCSEVARAVISRLPPRFKGIITDIIAVLIYLPIARVSGVLERLGLDVHSVPLSFYRQHSLYTMRTDARDRFGTPLEQRFTKMQIQEMMISCGLEDIVFADSDPYWCAVGFKVSSRCVE